MLKDIVFAVPLEGYRLSIRYEDVIDLGELLSFQGVVAPLKDLAYFRKVRVDPELGTVSRGLLFGGGFEPTQQRRAYPPCQDSPEQGQNPEGK